MPIRRWHNTCARAALVGLLVSGCGDGGSTADDQLPDQAAVCAAAKRAVEDITRTFPDAPADELRRMALEACVTRPTPVPDRPRTPVDASPGCRTPNEDDVVPVGRRTSHAPLPAALHARRTGALPADGTPTIAGVKLPRGSRCSRHWATDKPVADAFSLARKLAAAFPHTGLWPVLWSWQEDPDRYVGSEPDRVAKLDRLDGSEILRKLWTSAPPNPGASEPFDTKFPGLAQGSAGAGTGRDARNPFGALTRYPEDPAIRTLPFLLLVPVNRPADVPARLGTFLTEYSTGAEISAVLRSWEERFGAVVVELTPSTITLIVGAPPADERNALLLSAEHHAFSPPEDAGTAGSLRRLARLLRAGGDDGGGAGRPIPLAPGIWEIGWSD